MRTRYYEDGTGEPLVLMSGGEFFGALYSLDGYSGHLTRIDPATATITDVGLIRLADDAFTVYGGDLVQGANGTWYVWTNATQALYTLDITTAVATPVPNQVQGVNWYTGLAVDYQNGGTLYGSALFTDELVATGHTDTGIIMAVRHRELPLHGVQFHPESVLTEGGHRMLANFLAECGDDGAVERSVGLSPLVTAMVRQV